MYFTWAFAPASACNICWTNCWWLGSAVPDAGLVFSLGTELGTLDPVGAPVLPNPPKPGLNLHKWQKKKYTTLINSSLSLLTYLITE